jgi:membrane associated rhomboid family serine protease
MSAAGIIFMLTIAVSIVGLTSPKFIALTVLRPYAIARGSGYATLVTSGFVHADIAHLFFNLFTYYAFAFPLEHVIGNGRFAALYFSGLLISGLGTVVKHRDEPGYASLGASGAILAVLFAAIVYFPRQGIFILPLPVPIPAPLFAVAYLAFTYYSAHRARVALAQVQVQPPNPTDPPPIQAQPRDRINHDAHFFGALAGLAFVLLTDPGRYRALLHWLNLG